MAQILVPGGAIDLPEWHNPKRHLDDVSAKGSIVHIKGWTFDPDATGRSIYVGLFDGTTRIRYAKTGRYRTDVNTSYHISGYHGYRWQLAARNGTPHRSGCACLRGRRC